MKFRLLTLCLLVFMISCKSKNVIKSIEADMPELSESELLQKYKEKSFSSLKIETVKVNAKASYKIGESSHNLGLKFRIEKGQKIWLSADFLGIPVVKMLIEPSRVRYYNKFNKTFFDGSFALVKNLIGIDVSYDALEKLFMGDLILNVASDNYKFSISEDTYLFRDSKNKLSFSEGGIYPFTFKTKSQIINQANGTKKFATYYTSHQLLNGFMFPKELEFKADNKGVSTIITMIYNEVTFDEKLTFPYKVPKDCDQPVQFNRKK